jgi:hypothetical protein
MAWGSRVIPSPAWRTLIVGVALTVAFVGFLALVQFSTPDLVGTDDHFHIRFASLMRTEGLLPRFPWLPLTILNAREFYDHHFLFHVALIPFTVGDLIAGGKWASVVFTSLAFLSVWWLLRCQKVPYAALWSIGLLAVSEAFLFRMGMVRPMALSLAFLVLGLHFLLTNKATWLLPLGFLYVWLYDGFPFLLIVAAVYVLSTWWIDHKLNPRPLLYAAAGIALGMLLNPYFPDNVVFTLRHILPKLTETTAVDVGNEWYPYQTTTLLRNSPLALGAFLSGALALGLQERRIDARTLTAFLLAVLFGLMLFQSRRFIEYFPPFALIFAALAWTPIIKGWKIAVNTRQAPAESAVQLPRRAGWWISSRSWLPVGALALVLISGLWLTLRSAQASYQDAQPSTRYAAASSWLVENTPYGSRLFQTDWDDFPRLFYHNTQNTYLIGLDPTYMELYNAELYDLWVEITEGSVDHLSDVIPGRFGASYVISDLAHEDFLNQAEQDPNLREVYRDDEAVILQIIEGTN